MIDPKIYIMSITLSLCLRVFLSVFTLLMIIILVRGNQDSLPIR